MTNNEELVQSCLNPQNIKIEISVESLENFGKRIIQDFYADLQSKQTPKSDCLYISGERVCKILGISRVTLWNWDTKGITKPIRIGNLKRYRLSDIEAFGQSRHNTQNEM